MKLSFDHDTNQTRTVGMPLRASDFDHFDKIDPFTQMASNPAKLHRCVDDVKKQRKAADPWAVCNAAIKD